MDSVYPPARTTRRTPMAVRVCGEPADAEVAVYHNNPRTLARVVSRDHPARPIHLLHSPTLRLTQPAHFPATLQLTQITQPTHPTQLTHTPPSRNSRLSSPLPPCRCTSLRALSVWVPTPSTTAPASPRSTCRVVSASSVPRYASRAVRHHPNGGQFDFVWLPAHTPHGGASYVW